jgi:L,D-transpeptidase YcbB
MPRSPKTTDPLAPASHDPLRRALLRGLSALALVAGASPAMAQTNTSLLDQIFGNASRPPPDERKKPEVLDDLRPNAVPYRSEVMVEALEAAIKRYQSIEEKGGWPMIPGSKMIRPEDEDERVPVLRRRLQVTGELRSSGGGSSYSFDGELFEAVKLFQRNHGLRISGRVDRPTLQAMNVPVQARLHQMKLNVGRLRELLQGRIEDRYVLVNAPAFQLEAVEKHEVQQRHRVIAGRVERQTPVVKATIRALNFFPFWTALPRSI